MSKYRKKIIDLIEYLDLSFQEIDKLKDEANSLIDEIEYEVNEVACLLEEIEGEDLPEQLEKAKEKINQLGLDLY
jgi:hypothetical protein